MSVLRRQRVADPIASAAPVERTSVVVQAEIDALLAEEDAADALLARLEGERADVLRTGDDAAAERHDAEIARAKRTIERQDLQNPATFEALKRELQQAKDREEAVRLVARQAAATAKVEALVAEFPEQYRAAVAEMARLMTWWGQVQREAEAAGVRTPHSVFRYRADREVSPERTETRRMKVYIDANTGRETLDRFPYIAVRGEDPPPDPVTGELPYRIAITGTYANASLTPKGTKVWPNDHKWVEVDDTVPAVIERGHNLPDLFNRTRIPRLTLQDTCFWPPGLPDG